MKVGDNGKNPCHVQCVWYRCSVKGRQNGRWGRGGVAVCVRVQARVVWGQGSGKKMGRWGGRVCVSHVWPGWQR